MNPNDETLMAFVDGQLPPQQLAHISQALEADAALRQRVATLRRQRMRVAAAFDAVLVEPIPERLTSLLASAPEAQPAPDSAQVIDWAGARAQREQRRHLPTWAQWGGMAASLAMGVALATLWSKQAPDTSVALYQNQGQLIAGGQVDKALSTQLASEPHANATTAVQLSFLDKGGHYCRTFNTQSMAGLACLQEGKWAVQAIATPSSAPTGDFRPATSTLPRAVLDAVDQRIAGNVLDGNAEHSARDRAWQR